MTLPEQLESAEAGSRELDALIARDRMGPDAVRSGGAGWPDGALIIPCYPGWQELPHYTTSLDAAMMLVPFEDLTNTEVCNLLKDAFDAAFMHGQVPDDLPRYLASAAIIARGDG